MTPTLGRITTGAYLLSDTRQGYFGMRIGHHLQSMPRQRPSYNCVHIHLRLLSDFQSLSPEQKEEIYHHVEEELKPGSGNRALTQRHDNFVCEALACGATGPNLQPHRDRTYKVFGEEYWVYQLPVQTLVIATVCHYQVVASHSYANFHSIDDLRQVLLNRYVERRRVSSIEPHPRKVYQDSSGKAAHRQFSIPSQRKTRSRDCTTSTPVGQ
jgi:hypothetical protein